MTRTICNDGELDENEVVFAEMTPMTGVGRWTLSFSLSLSLSLKHATQC